MNKWMNIVQYIGQNRIEEDGIPSYKLVFFSIGDWLKTWDNHIYVSRIILAVDFWQCLNGKQSARERWQVNHLECYYKCPSENDMN